MSFAKKWFTCFAVLVFATLVRTEISSSTVTAGDTLDISVHVQGDKRHNNNREPLLDGAKVSLKNTRTGQVWNAKSQNGRCLFQKVPLGPYEITASYAGVSENQSTKAAVSNVYFYLPVKQ